MKARRGTKGKTRNVSQPKRKIAKSAKATDVSAVKRKPESRLKRILTMFGSSASKKRNERRKERLSIFRRKAKNTLSKAINASEKVLDWGQSVAPVLLMGGMSLGAITPGAFATGMLGTQLIGATEHLIDRTVKEYNNVRSPTLDVHIARAGGNLRENIAANQAVENTSDVVNFIDEEGIVDVFERPFTGNHARHVIPKRVVPKQSKMIPYAPRTLTVKRKTVPGSKTFNAARRTRHAAKKYLSDKLKHQQGQTKKWISNMTKVMSHPLGYFDPDL